jgi:hypothetical protein
MAWRAEGVPLKQVKKLLTPRVPARVPLACLRLPEAPDRGRIRPVSCGVGVLSVQPDLAHDTNNIRCSAAPATSHASATIQAALTARHISRYWQNYAEVNLSCTMVSPLLSYSPVGTNPSRWQNPANQSSSGA